MQTPLYRKKQERKVYVICYFLCKGMWRVGAIEESIFFLAWFVQRSLEEHTKNPQTEVTCVERWTWVQTEWVADVSWLPFPIKRCLIFGSGIVLGRMRRLFLKLAIWQSKIRERELVFFCVFSLFINTRANRNHTYTPPDSCFLTMDFNEVKGFKCVAQPTHSKGPSFRSLHVGKEAQQMEVFSDHWHGASQ